MDERGALWLLPAAAAVPPPAVTAGVGLAATAPPDDTAARPLQAAAGGSFVQTGVPQSIGTTAAIIANGRPPHSDPPVRPASLAEALLLFSHKMTHCLPLLLLHCRVCLANINPMLHRDRPSRVAAFSTARAIQARQEGSAAQDDGGPLREFQLIWPIIHLIRLLKEQRLL